MKKDGSTINTVYKSTVRKRPELSAAAWNKVLLKLAQKDSKENQVVNRLVFLMIITIITSSFLLWYFLTK